MTDIHTSEHYNGITGACLPEHAMNWTPTDNMLNPDLAHNIQASMEAAGLWFDTHIADLREHGFEPGLQDKAGLCQVRSDKGWYLGDVSEKYSSFEQSDIARVFQPVMDAHKGSKVMRIFSDDLNKPGLTNWMQLDLGSTFEPVPGREIMNTLMVHWGHAGKASVRAFWCGQDITCTNMLSGLLASAKGHTLEFKLKHQRNLDSVISHALTQSGLIASDGVKAMSESLQAIGSFYYTEKQMQDFVRATYPVSGDPDFNDVAKWRNVVESIQGGQGHQSFGMAGTGFQLLSGVSEYEQYSSAGSRSGGCSLSAANSRWQSVQNGPGQKAIRRAYQYVSALAA